MPRYTVTVLRHQWAQVTVTADDEDAAMDLVQAKQGASAITNLPWETTLIDPIEVEEATTGSRVAVHGCPHCGEATTEDDMYFTDHVEGRDVFGYMHSGCAPWRQTTADAD